MPGWIDKFVLIVFSFSLFLNAALFVPQAIHLIKIKRSDELSLLTFCGFILMQIFTSWHGYLVQDYALMIGFMLSLLTCGWVTFLIIYYRWRGVNAKVS